VRERERAGIPFSTFYEVEKSLPNQRKAGCGRKVETDNCMYFETVEYDADTCIKMSIWK
jgi:hypothetical protein